MNDSEMFTLTSEEIARMLKKSVEMVQYHARKKHIPAKKIGRQWFFSTAFLKDDSKRDDNHDFEM